MRLSVKHFCSLSGPRAQDPVFQLRVDVPLVSVDVKVLDSRGQPMTSLTAKDFIIAEDGVEQQVSSFTSIDTPYNILLLFDRSGSTEELWTTMQRSADQICPESPFAGSCGARGFR